MTAGQCSLPHSTPLDFTGAAVTAPPQLLERTSNTRVQLIMRLLTCSAILLYVPVLFLEQHLLTKMSNLQMLKWKKRKSSLSFQLFNLSTAVGNRQGNRVGAAP